MSDVTNQKTSIPQTETSAIQTCSVGIIEKIRVPITQSRLGKKISSTSHLNK